MDLFEQRLVAEGVRAIEGDSPALSAPVSRDAAMSFEERLLQRAVALDPQLQIAALFTHFKGLTRNLFAVLSLLLFVLGASSVQQLFFSEQGTQINFFWAFALFFIPNLLSLCLWLLFFLRSTRFSAGWLARFSLVLLKAIEKRFNPQAAQHPHFWSLFKCYFRVAFSGSLGRYQLSVVTHLLWFSYFCGATLMLVVMLATHQVDFIWQTSILSLESFQWLTELLAYIPNMLGFPVPDSIQIAQSHLGVINVMTDAQQSRFVWSSLLISSLFIYGLVPRFLLWLLMRFLLTIRKKQFSLNLSNAYYVQLRQQLKPNITSLGVSDPDLFQQPSCKQIDRELSVNPLPDSFYPIAIELSDAQLTICKQHVKQYASEQSGTLQHICDFPSQLSLLKDFAKIEAQAIVLYVALSRLPDRGLLGFIKSLTAAGSKSFYLLLIDDVVSDIAQSDERRRDWYTLAAHADIPLDNIVHLKNSGGTGQYEAK
ncbi:MAG: DUF2868 domain-containing protein [Psychromonas sp.]|nr:DUF2868 domain-containing protein [Psychromonas sp.]